MLPHQARIRTPLTKRAFCAMILLACSERPSLWLLEDKQLILMFLDWLMIGVLGIIAGLSCCGYITGNAPAVHFGILIGGMGGAIVIYILRLELAFQFRRLRRSWRNRKPAK